MPPFQGPIRSGLYLATLKERFAPPISFSGIAVSPTLILAAIPSYHIAGPLGVGRSFWKRFRLMFSFIPLVAGFSFELLLRENGVLFLAPLYCDIWRLFWIRGIF